MCTLYIVHKTSIFLSTKRSAHVQVVRVPYIHHVITSLDRCVGGARRLQNVAVETTTMGVSFVQNGYRVCSAGQRRHHVSSGS